MSERRARHFVQKTSLIRTLRLAVLGLTTLLLLELLGFYLSSRSFLDRISNVHEIQTLSNSVSELHQITDSLGAALARPEPDGTATNENLRLYAGIYRQALAALLDASALPGHDAVSTESFDRVRKAALDLNEAATRHYADADPRDRARDLLIAEQFDDDVAETLDKLKLGLSRRADQVFQAAYTGRYSPLMYSVLLAAALTAFSLSGGLHLIRRLQTGIVSLIEATREAARGNMEIEAPILSQDEIGALAYSFNEMAAALRNRDEFLSIASHELKTPITSLSLQLQVFLRELRKGAPPAKLESIAESSERESRRLAELIDGLLDLTRIRLGQLIQERRETDLSLLTRTVADRFALETREKGILLTVKAPDPVVGFWDPVRIDQVLSNLISNAIKYGNGKPISVAVKSAPPLRLACLTVKDHGMGVPPDMLDRIFERYERVDNAAVKRIAGFGLGLYVCRQIVRSHGGTIRVESKVGEGSTFIVEIPLSLQAALLDTA